jgi:hypothetical protein
MAGNHRQGGKGDKVTESQAGCAQEVIKDPFHGDYGGARINREPIDNALMDLSAHLCRLLADGNFHALSGEINRGGESRHARTNNDDTPFGHWAFAGKDGEGECGKGAKDRPFHWP